MINESSQSTTATAQTAISRAMGFITGDKVRTVVLYAAIAIWIIYRMLYKTYFGVFFAESDVFTGDFIRHRMLLLIAFCELCYIYKHGYDKKDAVALLVFALMAWGLYHNGFKDILYDAIFVFAARHADFKHLLRFATAIVTVVLAVVIVCSQVGVIEDTVLVQGSSGQRVRHCLGFRYCLFPAQYLFAITLAICILRDRKATWIGIVVLAVANIAMYVLTDSRLSVALAMLALVVIVIRTLPWRIKDKSWQLAGNVSSWAFVFVAVLSIAIVGIYGIQVAADAQWLDGINGRLGNRIAYAYNGIADMGSSLFGQKVQWVGNGLNIYGEKGEGVYNYVDNLFFHSFIQYGWVYTIGLFALYTAAARKMSRDGQVIMAIMFAILALHFTLDDLCLELHYNILLFAISIYLMGAKCVNEGQPIVDGVTLSKLDVQGSSNAEGKSNGA